MTLNILISPFESETRKIERVSVNNSGVQGNFHSRGSSISSDGHCVAFDSVAVNLVSVDINGYSHVYVSYTVQDSPSPPGGGGSGGCFISTAVSGFLIKPHVTLLMLFFGIGIIGFAEYRRKIRK